MLNQLNEEQKRVKFIEAQIKLAEEEEKKKANAHAGTVAQLKMNEKRILAQLENKLIVGEEEKKTTKLKPASGPKLQEKYRTLQAENDDLMQKLKLVSAKNDPKVDILAIQEETGYWRNQCKQLEKRMYEERKKPVSGPAMTSREDDRIKQLRAEIDDMRLKARKYKNKYRHLKHTPGLLSSNPVSELGRSPSPSKGQNVAAATARTVRGSEASSGQKLGAREEDWRGKFGRVNEEIATLKQRIEALALKTGGGPAKHS